MSDSMANTNSTRLAPAGEGGGFDSNGNPKYIPAGITIELYPEGLSTIGIGVRANQGPSRPNGAVVTSEKSAHPV